MSGNFAAPAPLTSSDPHPSATAYETLHRRHRRERAKRYANANRAILHAVLVNSQGTNLHAFSAAVSVTGSQSLGSVRRPLATLNRPSI